ncbi:MAG: FAD-dependent oxidoreductase [Pseudomonadota bacterium]
MRIAIVGGGISGLTAAYRLGQRFDTVIYEAERWLGGHTHTISVNGPDGPLAVDTGFIVYNERNYPRFTALLNELGVATQPSVMSFGVHDVASGIEYSGTNLKTLFAQPTNLLSPRYWSFLREILRFNRLANAALETDIDPTRTLTDFLDEHRLSSMLRSLYLLPMASAIWSTGEAKIGDYPLATFLQFFANHGLIGLTNRPAWRVISGGSERYVDTLRRQLQADIRVATPISAVMRTAEGVAVHGADGFTDNFDAVVFACHPDQALVLLGESASSAEREVLGAIPYTENSVVLHTDEAVLPQARRAWSAWNYWCDTTSGDSRPAVTYSMNTLQSLPTKTHYLVTLNRDDDVAADHVIDKFAYSHPIYTPAGLAAQERHSEISGKARTYYCGAYWGYGFHEDGVVSGERVATQLLDAVSQHAA